MVSTSVAGSATWARDGRSASSVRTQWHVTQEGSGEDVLQGALAEQVRADLRTAGHASRAQRRDEEDELEAAADQADRERSGSVHSYPTVDEPLDDVEPAGQRGVLEHPGGESWAFENVGHLRDEYRQRFELAAPCRERRLLQGARTDTTGSNEVRTVFRRARPPSGWRGANMVDEREGHRLGSFEDEGSVARVGHSVAQRAA